MEIIIAVVFLALFVLLVWSGGFGVLPCRNGHILPRTPSGQPIRHILTHCERCGVYLGEAGWNTKEKIKNVQLSNQ